MSSPAREVQPLDKRGVFFAVIVIALAGVFETVMYSAPGVFARPLWAGSALTLALVLGFLSFLIPVVIAWLICRKDAPSMASQSNPGTRP
ncbi:MAG: hypothetical protein EXQ84_03145 [Rhodospirillaceae bacterium]|nr:hypothetical protein [Rhodospirillaceae bacterium]